MTPEEKIEALREWANRPVTDGAQLASLNWYREAQRQVRDIIDPPKPKWRQMVNEEAEKSLIGTPIGAVLYHLSHVANPSEYDAAFELANIIAVCEAQVGDGWQADPDEWWGDTVTMHGLLERLACLEYEFADWQGLGHAAAAWLRSLTDGGAA